MRAQRNVAALLTVVTLGAGLTGCSSMNRTGKGAVIGAAGGAAVGAVIGKQVGSTARGAIIGAAVGGAAGAIIGRQMDKQAEELAATIPGATVQRVGEGIVVTFDSGLLFPFNSTDLLPAGRDNLRNLAESLKSNPETEVLIVGHTDAVGSDSYNQNLSEQRASSAASILASNGVPRDRIRTSGRGEMEPVADNESEAGRQQNRRVEVAIFASEEYRERLLRNNQGGAE
jgi:outer membrane protein OmpA-like peptidoglycan-associated protein